MWLGFLFCKFWLGGGRLGREDGCGGRVVRGNDRRGDKERGVNVAVFFLSYRFWLGGGRGLGREDMVTVVVVSSSSVASVSDGGGGKGDRERGLNVAGFFGLTGFGFVEEEALEGRVWLRWWWCRQ
ncbi:hypothetical protein E2542_SST04806 [Spatholobus suberectus]|nr:hypothetical protein E2542_SST04806 [Spatholobus suberectus]